MKTLCGRVDKKTYDLLQQKCDEMGLNKSQYISSLIRKDLELEKDIITEPKIETGMLSSLKKAFGVTEIKIPNVKTKPKRIKNSPKPEAIWIPPHSARKEYKGKLKHIGEKITAQHINSAKNSHSDLRITMSELLVINEVYQINKEFKVKDIKEFQKIFHLKKHTVQQLLWNLMESNFDEVISEFKKEIANVKFDIAGVGNFIVMNGRMSELTIQSAKEIVSIMQNANRHEIKIWELQQSYRYNDPLHIRIIADNYDNSDLLNLLKNTTLVEVVNNPSKRRNIIRNF